MTTEHLDIPEEEIDKILGGLGKAVRNDNDGGLDKDIAGIDTQVENLALGVAAAIQRKLDEQAELEAERDHRRAQREQIKNRAQRMLSLVDDEPAPAPQPAAPVASEPVSDNPPTVFQPPVRPVPDVVDEYDEDDLLNGLYTRDELMEFSNEDLQRLGVEYGIDFRGVVDDDNRNYVIGLIIVDQSRYCEREGIEDPNGTTTNLTFIERVRDSRHNPRHWNMWQWVGAFLGLLIAYLVWTIWPEWPGRNIDNDGVRTFVNFVWCIAHLAFGFFVGATIGAALEERREN